MLGHITATGALPRRNDEYGRNASWETMVVIDTPPGSVLLFSWILPRDIPLCMAFCSLMSTGDTFLVGWHRAHGIAKQSTAYQLFPAQTPTHTDVLCFSLTPLHGMAWRCAIPPEDLNGSSALLFVFPSLFAFRPDTVLSCFLVCLPPFSYLANHELHRHAYTPPRTNTHVQPVLGFASFT